VNSWLKKSFANLLIFNHAIFISKKQLYLHPLNNYNPVRKAGSKVSNFIIAKKHTMKTTSDLFYKIIIILLLFPLGVFAQGNGLYKFRGDDYKYGFMDKTGKVIIKPIYLRVGYPGFSEGLVFVLKEITPKGNELWICIDSTGKIIFELDQYSSPAKTYSEGFAAISNWPKGICYYINKKGEKVFDKNFGVAGSFSSGYALVSDEKYGYSGYYFIDKRGERANHLPFNCTNFINGMSYCNSYLIDTLGNILIDSIDEWRGNDYEYVKVKRNGKWGFVDQKGNIIIDFIYTEDRDRYYDQKLHLNIDSLNAIPKDTYRNVGFFLEGFAPILKDSLYGFINTKNEIVIEPIFRGVGYFSEGFAGATIDGILWGFIDTKGEFVIQPQFYFVDAFKHGICGVLYKEKPLDVIVVNDYRLDAIINKKGEILSSYKMHSYMGFRGDLIQFYDFGDFGGKIHYLDKNGILIIPR